MTERRRPVPREKVEQAQICAVLRTVEIRRQLEGASSSFEPALVAARELLAEVAAWRLQARDIDAAMAPTLVRNGESLAEAVAECLRRLREENERLTAETIKDFHDCEDQLTELREQLDTAIDSRDAAIANVRQATRLRGWRPIETAPKDGTLILGYQADGDDTRQIVAWFARCSIWLMQECVPADPTHWQPLPSCCASRAGITAARRDDGVSLRDRGSGLSDAVCPIVGAYQVWRDRRERYRCSDS